MGQGDALSQGLDPEEGAKEGATFLLAQRGQDRELLQGARAVLDTLPT